MPKWISLPANCLLKGPNSLKIWSDDGKAGTIKKVRAYASQEAGQIKAAFKRDGSLSGESKKGTSVVSYVTAAQAQEKAESFAAAKADLVKEEAKAHADGIVDEAEVRIIDVAQAKADLAEVTAKAYADEIVTVAEQAAIDAAQAKVDAAEARQRVYADGIVTDAEQRTLNAANAQAAYAETKAKAYADGIVTAEEQRAIADAKDKADAAEAAAKEHTENWSQQGADNTQDALSKDPFFGTEVALARAKGKTLIQGGYINTEILQVGSAEIRDAAIQRGHIGEASVDTLRIAGNAVTVPSAVSLTGAKSVSTSDIEVIRVVGHDTYGAPTLLNFTGAMGAAGDGISNIWFDVWRDGTILTSFGYTYDGGQTPVCFSWLDTGCTGMHDYYISARTETALTCGVRYRNISLITCRR